ncbi:hypothetical protein ACOSQ2_012115 [Xanthoceras sorbifolium]
MREETRFDIIKKSSDGSRSGKAGHIAAGGVLSDQNRRWIKGFAVSKRYRSTVKAELRAILEGLFMTWDVGFRRVQVDSDSLEAVALINGECNDNNPLLHLVHRCRSLMNRNWPCVLEHVFRKSNCVADCLAR